ncbi:class I SAM-dependent methyltransferase [Mesorhizobium sp. KR9-304]|uniref:class I SAM-dependent methyltransferase n=1 Tax=Mesorhizobium sp. KR9-304 TaxID=3156614 RepID=UPI0032B4DC5C
MRIERTSRTANAQYNRANPDSVAISIATEVRADMYRMATTRFPFTKSDLVLDVGVTSDRSYASSNYFEQFYPWKNKIVAAGIDDARFLEELHPGVRFVHADALDLPFEDASFDYVHSSAVLEHVGSFENQRRMIAECARVARKGICLTTPNRWFPVEFHTQLPLLHWLPKPLVPAHSLRHGAGGTGQGREPQPDDGAQASGSSRGYRGLVIPRRTCAAFRTKEQPDPLRSPRRSNCDRAVSRNHGAY